MAIIDNLVSTSTTDSLSANMGRQLKFEIDNAVIRIADNESDVISNATETATLAARVTVVESNIGFNATNITDLNDRLLAIESSPSGVDFSVVDNLTSTSTTDALSANQGRVLNDMYFTLNSDYILTKSDVIDNANNIANHESRIVAIENNGGAGFGVVDSLLSTSTTDALSANQGKVLKDGQDNLDTRISTAESDLISHNNRITIIESNQPQTPISVSDNLTDTSTTNALSANQGVELKALVDDNTNEIYDNQARINNLEIISGITDGELPTGFEIGDIRISSKTLDPLKYIDVTNGSVELDPALYPELANIIGTTSSGVGEDNTAASGVVSQSYENYCVGSINGIKVFIKYNPGNTAARDLVYIDQSGNEHVSPLINEIHSTNGNAFVGQVDDKMIFISGAGGLGNGLTVIQLNNYSDPLDASGMVGNETIYFHDTNFITDLTSYTSADMLSLISDNTFMISNTNSTITNYYYCNDVATWLLNPSDTSSFKTFPSPLLHNSSWGFEVSYICQGSKIYFLLYHNSNLTYKWALATYDMLTESWSSLANIDLSYGGSSPSNANDEFLYVGDDDEVYMGTNFRLGVARVYNITNIFSPVLVYTNTDPESGVACMYADNDEIVFCISKQPGDDFSEKSTIYRFDYYDKFGTNTQNILASNLLSYNNYSYLAMSYGQIDDDLWTKQFNNIKNLGSSVFMFETSIDFQGDSKSGRDGYLFVDLKGGTTSLTAPQYNTYNPSYKAYLRVDEQ